MTQGRTIEKGAMGKKGPMERGELLREKNDSKVRNKG